MKSFKRTHVNQGLKCSVTDCAGPAHSKGMCAKHRSRMLRYGRTDVTHRHFWSSPAAKNLWHGAKYRSKQTGLAFDLRPEDIVIPRICPVLGIPIRVSSIPHKQCDGSPSLDRREPSKGYVKGNVIVISWLANRLKSNATPTQLLLVALYAKGTK